MKKRFLASIVMILMVVSPISVYADEQKTSNQNDLEKTTIGSSIDDYESKVTIEYKPEQQQELPNAPQIGCKAAYVVDPTTGKVFYEKNAHQKMYPASTTKILTALVVLEKCKLTDTAKVSQNALDLVPSGVSNIYLKAGEELTISALLHALLIPSANEAANVLAEHVSGSVEAFADLCNTRAKELGCETLHFVNPNGLHDENHYCSAYDLYLIAKECQKYDEFNEIVKTKSYKIPPTNVHPANDRTVTNTNLLLFSNSPSYYYQYCTGIKTGTTTPAGECLIASSSHNNIDLISVVLGGGTNSKGLHDRFYDTKQLFDFVYNNYSYKEIVKKKDVIKTINVEKATKDTASLDVIVNTSISAIVPNDFDITKADSKIDMNEKLIAPIEQNQVLGYVSYEVDGLNYTAEILASHTVEKFPYWIVYSAIVGGIILLLLIFSVTIKKHKRNRY